MEAKLHIHPPKYSKIGFEWFWLVLIHPVWKYGTHVLFSVIQVAVIWHQWGNSNTESAVCIENQCHHNWPTLYLSCFRSMNISLGWSRVQSSCYRIEIAVVPAVNGMDSCRHPIKIFVCLYLFRQKHNSDVLWCVMMCSTVVTVCVCFYLVLRAVAKSILRPSHKGLQHHVSRFMELPDVPCLGVRRCEQSSGARKKYPTSQNVVNMINACHDMCTLNSNPTFMDWQIKRHLWGFFQHRSFFGVAISEALQSS